MASTMQTQRQISIPKSEREMARAREGELIRLTVNFNGKHISRDLVFKGYDGQIDTFVKQSDTSVDEDVHKVFAIRSVRAGQRYDGKLGVILQVGQYTTDTLNHLHPEYESSMELLRNAGLMGVPAFV